MAVEEVSPEVMLAYYRRLYPFKSIFTWLNHSHTPTKLFTNREFAFTLQGDVYLRYNSFNNADELKKQVLALNPTRFEIGPMYSARVWPLYSIITKARAHGTDFSREIDALSDLAPSPHNGASSFSTST